MKSVEKNWNPITAQFFYCTLIINWLTHHLHHAHIRLINANKEGNKKKITANQKKWRGKRNAQPAFTLAQFQLISAKLMGERNRILQQCYQADVIYQQQQQKDGKRINKKKESITRVMKIINAWMNRTYRKHYDMRYYACFDLKCESCTRWFHWYHMQCKAKFTFSKYEQQKKNSIPMSGRVRLGGFDEFFQSIFSVFADFKFKNFL